VSSAQFRSPIQTGELPISCGATRDLAYGWYSDEGIPFKHPNLGLHAEGFYGTLARR
jgi:hypothetical protein